MADFIIIAILVAAVALIIRYQRKRKAQGAPKCGPGCAGCSGCTSQSLKNGGEDFQRICRKKKKKSF